MAAAATADRPVEQLRRARRSLPRRRVHARRAAHLLLDAPSVLAGDVRRELAERYGLGLVRGALRRDRGRRGACGWAPVDALAPVVLAALHEAATLVADGADRADVRSVVDGILDAITTTLA